jgi:CdiI immunity protein
VSREPLPSPFHLLVSGYFHQDWDLNGHDAHEVIEKFAREMPPEDVAEARAAAAELLANGLDEDELETHLHALGLGYGPEFDGLDHRGWLELIVETLSASD